MRNIVYYDVSGNCCRVNYNVVIECSKEICLLYRADYLSAHLQRLCFLSIFCISLLCASCPPPYPWGAAEYCNQNVCMSVCPLIYLKNHMSRLLKIFSTCYLWLWVSTLMQLFIYVQFCDDVMFLRDVSQWEAVQRGSSGTSAPQFHPSVHCLLLTDIPWM